MNTKRVLKDIVITIPIVFIVAAIVTFAYNFIVDGSGVFEWDTAFRLALILGIAMPIVNEQNRKSKD